MAERTTQQEQKGWRNRIVRMGVKPASEFVAHPMNWRIHPRAQQEALEGALDETGWVAPVIESERTGYMLDGHARIALALRQGDDTPVPYITVDLDEDEEPNFLSWFDPISAMAVADKQKLDELLRRVDTGSAALQETLAGLSEKAGLNYAPSIAPLNVTLDDIAEAKHNLEQQFTGERKLEPVMCPFCGRTFQIDR